jgi:hypothetical protein
MLIDGKFGMKRFVILFLMSIMTASLVLAEDSAPLEPVSIAQDGLPVQQIPLDFGVVGGYQWMRVTGRGAQAFDAPGGDGDVLYTFKDGYDFVTPRNFEEDWVEVNPGEWVEADNLTEVFASQFRGVVVQGDPGVPWGWILVTHFASAAPGGVEVQEDAYKVTKYQLAAFVGAQVGPDGLTWYDVGGGKWVKQTLVSKVERVGNPGVSGRWVAVDLFEQNLVAYENDTIIFATLISSGLPGNDTNPGVFDIYAKTANAAMDGTSGGYGNYRLENVPYAMYFDNDISLHGTYWHNGFGYRQSRGCVNLTISDARWLFEWLGESAHVYVFYSQPY